MNAGMTFRSATAADVDLLANFNLQLIEDEKHRNTMGFDGLRRRMAGWLERGEYRAVLFELNGEPAGYALFGEGEYYLHLRQFFVCRGMRRRGVGRAAVEWLRENVWRDAPRIRVDVLVGNGDALAFYRAMGFTDYCVTLELERGT